MDAIGIIVFAAVLYFLPLLIAASRHHNVTGVAIVNALLGWTVVGWIIALIMACGNNQPQVVIQQQAPPEA